MSPDQRPVSLRSTNSLFFPEKPANRRTSPWDWRSRRFEINYDECIALREETKYEVADGHGFDATHAHTDCFMVSGSKVLEGYGRYVVMAVGQKSFFGPESNCCFAALRGDPDPTPLQEKSNKLAKLIAKIGGAAGLA